MNTNTNKTQPKILSNSTLIKTSSGKNSALVSLTQSKIKNLFGSPQNPLLESKFQDKNINENNLRDPEMQKLIDIKKKFQKTANRARAFGLGSSLKKTFLVKALTIREKEDVIQNLNSFYDLNWEIYNENTVRTFMNENDQSIGDFLKFYKNNAEILFKPVISFKGHLQGITDLKFSEDCQSLISSSKDLTIKIWDTIKEEEVFYFFYILLLNFF